MERDMTRRLSRDHCGLIFWPCDRRRSCRTAVDGSLLWDAVRYDYQGDRLRSARRTNRRLRSHSCVSSGRSTVTSFASRRKWSGRTDKLDPNRFQRGGSSKFARRG